MGPLTSVNLDDLITALLLLEEVEADYSAASASKSADTLLSPAGGCGRSEYNRGAALALRRC